jgi:hypothetical protein
MFAGARRRREPDGKGLAFPGSTRTDRDPGAALTATEYRAGEASFHRCGTRGSAVSGRWARRPLTCPEVGRLLQRYLDGEIGELKAQRIARHLEDCRRCGLKAETYSAIKRSLREHRPAVPADALQRLRGFAEQLAAEEPTDESAGA